MKFFCNAEEYINPETKLADCLYQCEKYSRSNHSANKEPKLLFKVWCHILHPEPKVQPKVHFKAVVTCKVKHLQKCLRAVDFPRLSVDVKVL